MLEGKHRATGSQRLPFVLNVVLIALYIVLAAQFLPDLQQWLYWTPDARGYREAGQWLLSPTGAAPQILSRRPYPYPLMVGILSDPYSIWASQFLLWLAAVNLTALSAANFVVRHRAVAWLIAFMVVGGSVTLALLTFHALTEAASVFLIGLWLYVLSRSDLAHLNTKGIIAITFPLSVLVLVKPMFQPHLLLFTGALMWVNRKRIEQIILPLVIALVPIAIELIINKHLFDMLAISDVTSLVFRDYFVPRVYGYVQEIDWRMAAPLIQPMSAIEMLRYIAAHPVATLKVHLIGVVYDNLLAGTDFAPGFPFLQKLALIHRYLLLALLYAISPLAIMRGRQFASHRKLKLGMLLVFAALIIFSTGTSFTQGDRPIQPSLPLLAVATAGIAFGPTTEEENEFHKHQPSNAKL